MNMDEDRRHRDEKKRRALHNTIVIGGGILLIAIIVTTGIMVNYKKTAVAAKAPVSAQALVASQTDAKGSSKTDSLKASQDEASHASSDAPDDGLATLLSKAKDLADGYDYDGAMDLISRDSQYGSSKEASEAIALYTEEKSKLVRVDPKEVTHVFFHSLIIDTKKAFDGDAKQGGYNQMMTTKSEFLKILKSMYDKGYVLVKIHDLAREITDEDGNAKFVYGDIMLPEGKKAFVMSQDDVCYYEYMEGDGFAARMVIGDDGYPTTQMQRDGEGMVTGDYDLVPILEHFIQKHPDFSYKGARAIIALTGYNGILGYRTDEAYKDKNPNFEADKKQAAAVAQCLRDHGFELASHSWGHRNLGTIPMNHFKMDAQKWKRNVESLIGPTDIMIYPFGSDIGTWHPYTLDNQRYAYLKSLGFRYFCNVDASTPYWIQLGPDYLRQGRRNLDGYRMYYDPDGLRDLFNAADVLDPARPMPVPAM